MKNRLKIRISTDHESMEVISYELSQFQGCDSLGKEGLSDWIFIERERIELALEQLKDIEKMSEEL